MVKIICNSEDRRWISIAKNRLKIDEKLSRERGERALMTHQRTNPMSNKLGKNAQPTKSHRNENYISKIYFYASDLENLSKTYCQKRWGKRHSNISLLCV